jgi:choline dehydrogenase-like flavoprotein
MTFRPSDFQGFVATDSEVQRRLFSQYLGQRDDFDLIIVGSGMGGGLLADDLADRVGQYRRILVLEAGSFLFPTHVYNTSRFDNGDVARSFACQNYYQTGGSSDERYIHEMPQLNFGGRSVFWSGLIPTVQPWELEFFPAQVRADLSPDQLRQAGVRMNQSMTLGTLAEELVAHLRTTSLSADFIIEQTPRALHQPYLTETGGPRGQYFIEPTGVFNTAELLMNQLGRDRDHNGSGLHLQIHQYVEDIEKLESGWFRLTSRTVTTGQPRFYYAPRVILAAGSIESPKLLHRSTLGRGLDPSVRFTMGRGLTDHPTTDSRAAAISHAGSLAIPKNEHAKIILYSRGHVSGGQIQFPFNVEVNINHQYWHQRNNDPDLSPPAGASVLDFKFSFANPIDDDNAVYPAGYLNYVPQIDFRNLNWTSHIVERTRRLAGWNKSPSQIFDVLNGVGDRLLAEFKMNGGPVSASARLGEWGKGFGRGTVHHAVGTLRMPWQAQFGAGITPTSVVDENLALRSTSGLYVCDMSVMPISSAANPVRTLAALAFRLSRHLEA